MIQEVEGIFIILLIFSVPIALFGLFVLIFGHIYHVQTAMSFETTNSTYQFLDDAHKKIDSLMVHFLDFTDNEGILDPSKAIHQAILSEKPQFRPPSPPIFDFWDVVILPTTDKKESYNRFNLVAGNKWGADLSLKVTFHFIEVLNADEKAKFRFGFTTDENGTKSDDTLFKSAPTINSDKIKLITFNDNPQYQEFEMTGTFKRQKGGTPVYFLAEVFGTENDASVQYRISKVELSLTGFSIEFSWEGIYIPPPIDKHFLEWAIVLHRT